MPGVIIATVDQFDEDEFPDVPPAPAALLAALCSVPDPRSPRGRRHGLVGILALAACAVIAGARSFVSIAQWGHLGDPGRGRPPRDHRRDAQRIHHPANPEQCRRDGLDEIIGTWAALRPTDPQHMAVIGVDGKSLRGSGLGDDRCRHLLAALDHTSGIVLGQRDVDHKTNESPCSQHCSTTSTSWESWSPPMHCIPRPATRGTWSRTATRTTCSP